MECAKNWMCFAFSLLCLWDEKFTAQGRHDIGSNGQKWGYVTVRPHAHMFWWLYYTTADVPHYTDRPLIIWLQGGPGIPSSGFGNFIEIGPLTMDLTERKHTWVKDFNVVFVDNPVGVGFSYTSNSSCPLVRNNKEIGEDLVRFLKSFLGSFEEFQPVPLYIFGESYGGKMTVAFAHQILKETKKKNMNANLKGIGLGDAYISPIDYIMNYAPFSLNLGLIDKHGYNKIDELARQTKKAINEQRFEDASKIESQTANAVLEETRGIDIYNIVFKSNSSSTPLFLSYHDGCNDFMNNVIKPKLNISKDIEWDFLSDDIYASLHDDFIKPVTSTIADILDNSGVKVIVYNGVFDLIVNTPGTVNWLDNLEWHGKHKWANATQEAVEVNMVNEGYVKRADNLVFYAVLRAGHSVPVDNPVAMEEILRREILETDGQSPKDE